MTLPEIIARLQRLSPSHRDPEAFHEEKAELVEALRRLASNDNRPASPRVWRAG